MFTKCAGALNSNYESLQSNKINTSAIANNLTTTASGHVLDARQGKALNDKITVVSSATFVNSKLPSGVTNQGCTAYKIGRVVVMTLNLKASTQLAPATINQDFIPNSHKPAYGISLMLSDGTATGQSVGTLNPTGTLIIYFGANKYAQGSFVFFGS